jgi:protein PhnA
MEYGLFQMTSQNSPKLVVFLNTRISDGEPDQDIETARAHGSSLGEAELQSLIQEIRDLRSKNRLDLTHFGTEGNRWFADSDEAVTWLGLIEATLESVQGQDETRTALDCNGTPLQEEDSVTVIKDLKVKGGSSDLKRGTLIRKIRLTADPKMIECRVDGSVLVLKTEFLKRA